MAGRTRAQDVRRTFASSRMRAAWSMLSSSVAGDRMAAIEGVARILESEGLSLADVPDAMLAVPSGPYRGRRTEQDDLFSHADRRDGMTVPTMRVVSGRDVPERVGGRIAILDDRTTRTGPELIVAVVGFEVRYDPISAKCPRSVAALRSAAASGTLTQVAVRPPASSRQMPEIHMVGMGIAF